MSTRDWRQLCHESWDRGVDPADDPVIIEHLAAHPEHLEEFATWRNSVGALADVSSPRRRRSLVWASVLAATTLAVAWPALATTEAQAEGSVLSSTLESSSESPGLVVSWREHHVLSDTDRTYFAITTQRSVVR